MINETRNELLTLINVAKYRKDDENSKFYINLLLERFEYDLKDKLKDLEYETQQVKDNLKTLEYVKEEIEKGEK